MTNAIDDGKKGVLEVEWREVKGQDAFRRRAIASRSRSTASRMDAMARGRVACWCGSMGCAPSTRWDDVAGPVHDMFERRAVFGRRLTRRLTMTSCSECPLGCHRSSADPQVRNAGGYNPDNDYDNDNWWPNSRYPTNPHLTRDSPSPVPRLVDDAGGRLRPRARPSEGRRE